jgi:IS5 family transposase
MIPKPSTVLPELLHGQETRVWGDQAYRGQRAVIDDARIT